MSNFFSAGFLKPQYFNAQYLSGGDEAKAQSGWRRLIIAQLQEAANENVVTPQLNEAPGLTSTVVPFNAEASPDTAPKKPSRASVNTSPEEEIAKDVLNVLQKPIYRQSPPVVLFEPLIFGVTDTRDILRNLWARLGVNVAISEITLVEVDANAGRCEGYCESEDEEFLLMAMAL